LSFGKHLEKSGVMGSMGAVGSALDNAMAESFFASLQTELLDRYEWTTRDSLKTAIFDYIEIFYNRTRRHSSLDYLSPHDYERREVTKPAPAGAKLPTVHQNG
jgi:transposase InsO family protein